MVKNCSNCGRDTKSATGICHNCMPHPLMRKGNDQSGKGRGRKQQSTRRQWLEAGEIPRFDPIDPEADKDREWDGFADD